MPTVPVDVTVQIYVASPRFWPNDFVNVDVDVIAFESTPSKKKLIHRKKLYSLLLAASLLIGATQKRMLPMVISYRIIRG